MNGISKIETSNEELETETGINVGQVIEPDDFTITKAQAKEKYHFQWRDHSIATTIIGVCTTAICVRATIHKR